MNRVEMWGKGIAGAANGMTTGLAAVGIDPGRFNLQSGLRPTLGIAGASAMMSAVMAVAAYLKQSPLPSDDAPLDRDERVPRRE